jgi:DNA repair exonuclease SbcCD ATPase subunit
MPNYFLTNLQIEGFRGVNNEGDPFQVSFKSDSVNSIFGGNALGKSSLFEALCFAIKGYVPKLADLQRSEQANDYYVNQFHTARTATIALSLQPADGSAAVKIRIRRLPDGSRVVDSPSGHSAPDELLASLNSEFCLVDYRTFLKFVEDSPLNRGRAFSGLLGLAPLSEFRQALEVLANTRTLQNDLQLMMLQTRLASVTQTITTIEAQLRRLFTDLTGVQITGDLNETTIAEQATEALKNISVLTHHFSQATIINADFDEIRRSIRDAEKSAEQERLRQLTSIIAELDALSVDASETSEVSELGVLIQHLEFHLALTKGPLLRTHYQSAINVLQSSEWNDPAVCPTCETTQRDPLLAKLQGNIASYTDVEGDVRQIRERWPRTVFSARLAGLTQSNHISTDLIEQKRYEELSALARNGNLSSGDWEEVTSFRTTLESRRSETLAILKAEQQKLENELPPSLVTLTEQVGLAEQLRQRLLELRNNRSELPNIQTKLSIRERWVQFITYASASFAEAEVALSTEKTLRLENDYRGMYRRITNNAEVIPRLIKATDSEDLYLILERFYGRSNLTATPLLAESYRNALALSIFLSSALQTSAASGFMVLDDVTSSFDAGHQLI